MPSEPPPAPYLATNKEDILRRVMRAEALRIGFQNVAAAVPEFEGGISVHGHFGSVEAWLHIDGVRAPVERTVTDEHGHPVGFASALLAYARSETDGEGFVQRSLNHLVVLPT